MFRQQLVVSFPLSAAAMFQMELHTASGVRLFHEQDVATHVCLCTVVNTATPDDLHTNQEGFDSVVKPQDLHSIPACRRRKFSQYLSDNFEKMHTQSACNSVATSIN